MSRARTRDKPAAKGTAGSANCVRSRRCHEFVVEPLNLPRYISSIVGASIVLTVTRF